MIPSVLHGAANVTGTEAFLVVDGLNSDFDYIFTLAAVVTTDEGTVLGPLSEEVEFSFVFEGTSMVPMLEAGGEMVLSLVLSIICLSSFSFGQESTQPFSSLSSVCWAEFWCSSLSSLSLSCFCECLSEFSQRTTDFMQTFSIS